MYRPMHAARYSLVVVACDLLFFAFETTSIWAGRVPDRVVVQGMVEPTQIAKVYPQVAGKIEKIGTDPADASKAIGYGTFVKEGTILAQLDTQIFDADLAKAKADLELAAAKFEQARQNESSWW